MEGFSPSICSGWWCPLKNWDVFISHATEDKDAVARPLADALIAAGLRVWYDEYTLKLGDRLRSAIDAGLRHSRFGVVVLSEAFFNKKWPRIELDELASLETYDETRILPIWHRVTRQQVSDYSAQLADRYAVASDNGLPHIVQAILSMCGSEPHARGASPLAATEGENPRRELRRLAMAVLQLRRRVTDYGYDHGYSSDDDPVDDERGELDNLEAKYQAMREAFKDQYGTDWDPLSELESY